MTVRILKSAQLDLRRGYDFYERQEPGVGDYFLDTLFGEIDSLRLYAETHSIARGYFKMLSEKFPYAILVQDQLQSFTQCWIADEIPERSPDALALPERICFWFPMA
jgi:hypothetical protein